MENKNLKNEKSSLLTALKLMQNDYQQTCTKTIVENNGKNNVELACETIEGSEVTQPGSSSKQPNINNHSNMEANIGKNRKKNGKKSKPKSQTQNASDANTCDSTTNASSSKSTGQGKKTVVIAGDSIVKTLSVRK